MINQILKEEIWSSWHIGLRLDIHVLEKTEPQFNADQQALSDDTYGTINFWLSSQKRYLVRII